MGTTLHLVANHASDLTHASSEKCFKGTAYLVRWDPRLLLGLLTVLSMPTADAKGGAQCRSRGRRSRLQSQFDLPIWRKWLMTILLACTTFTVNLRQLNLLFHHHDHCSGIRNYKKRHVAWGISVCARLRLGTHPLGTSIRSSRSKNPPIQWTLHLCYVADSYRAVA